jgi:hypothetical protein
MFRVAGTVSSCPLDRATFIPPAGAAVERPIVQRVELPPVTEDGTQANEESVTAPAGVSVIVASFEEPL